MAETDRAGGATNEGGAGRAPHGAMSETASAQLGRIVAIVAALSRREAVGAPALTLSEVAAGQGTTIEQVQRDVRALTQASDEPDAEWLQSLSIWQEGDRLSISSRGPFRRPMRFSGDELLALQVGLATEEGGECVLSSELAGVVRAGGAAGADDPSVAMGLASGAGEAAVADLARRAMDERRVLSILYAGERDRAGTARSIEPHQVVFAEGRVYVVAWCRKSGGWRNFRTDRVIEAIPELAHFEPRSDFVPFVAGETVFRAEPDAVDDVIVKFSPEIARWLVERYPGANRQKDGSAVVTFQVADPAWLVRHVLQYGPDAEVLAPAEYREAVRRALG
jgi:proteasome accessory factor C